MKEKADPTLAAKKGTASWPVKLSVAIVNYKTRELTRKLLLSLLKENQNLEIVVLDNGSDDGLGELIKEQFPDVKFIQSQTNLGFSKGYNLALDCCHGQYLLMLNSDIEVRKGSIEKLLRAEEDLGREVVLTGKLILPDGTVQKSAFHLPNISGAIREFFFGQMGSFFGYLPNQNKPTIIDGAMMACLLIPKSVRNRIGKLDEGTSLYFEDVDYCRRLKQAGVPVYYVPEAVFDHHHGAASKKLSNGESLKKLEIASRHYHGWLKYFILTMVLWFGQKVKKLDHKRIFNNLSKAK